MDFAEQIVDGVTQADMDTCPGNTLTFPVFLNGEPGISAGLESEVLSIVGQVRTVLICDSINVDEYNIVGSARVVVLDANFDGVDNFLWVQPAP